MPVRGPLLRFLAGIGLVLVAALSVVGGIALRGPGLMAVLVSGAMAGCVTAGVARETVEPRRRSVLESALLGVAVTVVTLLVLSGTAMLAGGGAAVLLVGLAGAGWATNRWLRERRLRAALAGPAAGRLAGASSRPAGSLRGPVPTVDELSTGDLAEEWLRSGSVLQGALAPAARQGLVARRAQVLDELERRDPAGFARWMAAGPLASADPAGYLRSEPPRADPSAETEAA
ncbi:hypothetical protein [Blastococcus sp. LR1]|uniref:hypothetical protein n=1 Tax=Blastococcus sp. LR1 TaxID=2877000 RepID=UPI001CC919E0|nr:hypothetical protein [Blastococcus sp. LR1]MCA0144692.1 hypothetical protein [Blastococcus sp. LR1]